MTSIIEQDPQSVLSYALQVQEAVESASDDEDLERRVDGFPGGASALLEFLGEGMALAFDPVRSEGETGLVQFVIGCRRVEVNLWMRLEVDACYITGEGADPDAVLWMALPVFLRIAFKRIDGADAYLAGALEVVGDVVLATSIDDWFHSPVLAVRERMS